MAKNQTSKQQEENSTLIEHARAASAAAGYSLPDAYTRPLDEYTNANDEDFVIQDEWYGQIEVGNPFDEVAEPWKKANPGRHFRWLGKPTIARKGLRGYQGTTRKDGRIVECNGMILGSIPIEVKEARTRKLETEYEDRQVRKQDEMREQVRRAEHDSQGGIVLLNDFDTAKVRSSSTGLRGSDIKED